MKKIQRAKLSLSRETVRTLDEHALTEARGGIYTGYSVCYGTCASACHSCISECLCPVTYTKQEQ
jgi:hypothetical protein